MLRKSRGGKGLFYLFLAALLLVVSVQGSVAQSQLILRNPENMSARIQRSVTLSTNYNVVLTWDNVPRELGTIIHDPDLSDWSFVTPDNELSNVTVVDKYNYKGTIDRTISFRALNGGRVGVDPEIQLQYSIRGEERWQNIVNLGALSYSPGTPLPVIFRDNLGETLDLGIELSFSEGVIDSNGVFFVACEDFEGFHIWRGIVATVTNNDPFMPPELQLPIGTEYITDIEAIGEVSKQEAFDEAFCDSIYFNGMIPALRNTGQYTFTPGMTCFSNARDTAIDLPLAENQFFWIDYTAFNGFTYAYFVSTFDRGYNVSSGRQGLNKYDSFAFCDGDTIMNTVPCPELFTLVSVEVQPQTVLKRVYAVPNPYRSGSSVYTTPNYHNYPDNKIRFVNVPVDCTLEIFTAAGDLVWDTEHHINSGNIEWDVKNESGEDVASGIYIYKLEDSSGGSVYGRLVIIR